MQILFINNDGGGYADQIEIPEDTTVDELFRQRLPYGIPDDYLIRVNRLPSSRQQRLQPGDRVSITPTKIEGAAGNGGRPILHGILNACRSVKARCIDLHNTIANTAQAHSAVPSRQTDSARHANWVKAQALAGKGNNDANRTLSEAAHESRNGHSRDTDLRATENAARAAECRMDCSRASAATASES